MGPAIPIIAAVGAAASAAKSIAGSKSSSKSSQQVRSQLEMRPEDLQQLMAQRDVMQRDTGSFANLARQLQQQAAGAAPQLQAIDAPQFSTKLDPLSQALVAQGRQSALAQSNANQARFASQFRGQPGIARALQAQTRAQATAQQNPLMFQAAQQQTGRQLDQNQAMLQAQQAENQRRLAQFGAGASARQEQLGFNQSGLGAQAGLLSMLSQLGSQLGTQVKSGYGSKSGRSGGLF